MSKPRATKAGKTAKQASRPAASTNGKVAALAALAPQPPPKEHWKEEPDGHDFPAAAQYLSLVCAREVVDELVEALKHAPTAWHKAKDLLRASDLALLPPDNHHVAVDLAKVERGERLSPVLLVRGSLVQGAALTIADGYHRICASYHLDENAEIPCRLVSGPTASRR